MVVSYRRVTGQTKLGALKQEYTVRLANGAWGLEISDLEPAEVCVSGSQFFVSGKTRHL